MKLRIGMNQFCGESVTYEGVGTAKRWKRIESYGPKFVENIVQAISRDILCYAMQTLRHCSIVMHIHDEVVIEAAPRVSLDALCEEMGRTPSWAKGMILQAAGYVTNFTKRTESVGSLVGLLPVKLSLIQLPWLNILFQFFARNGTFLFTETYAV